MILLVKLLILGALAHASPVKVYFLPQTHGDLTDKYYEKVSRSQFWILRELLKLDQPAMFCEGFYQDVSERISDWSLAEQLDLGDADFRTLFGPEVLRGNFFSLSDGQKSLLSCFAAAQISVMMGNGILKASEDLELNQSANRFINSFVGRFAEIFNTRMFQKLVFNDREDEAVRRISEFTRSGEYHGQPIVLIYGRAHDFTRAFAAYPELELVTVYPACEIDLKGLGSRERYYLDEL